MGGCGLWGYDGEGDISVVWVYISYLRKKLESLQSNVKIGADTNFTAIKQEAVLLRICLVQEPYRILLEKPSELE